ncbi:uncharacterized protein L203_106259 [Cryptococcus depauperatus CBS 7841]|uniref:Uncharacterized protein n=1 Tax=Cryptococcus depauperatus CBS 7841 TaxID=1295531 RepID=A0AAJ8JYT6_9TREE
MPLSSRRPELHTISIPTLEDSNSTEQVHTPVSSTSIPIHEGPLFMTPSTSNLDTSLDMVLGTKRPFDIEKNDACQEEEWTDNEDGLLQGYLVHPPYPLDVKYVPFTLPPPAALDEITTQVFQNRSRNRSPTSPTKRAWKHSWKATRQRLFQIARAESLAAVGGHRRRKSDSVVPAPGQLEKKGQHSGPRLNKHLNDSMDSLFGDEQPGRFSETLRLSTALQETALGGNKGMNITAPTLSPLLENYLCESQPKPPSLITKYSQQFYPVNLLQRGRSIPLTNFEHGATSHTNDTMENDSATTISPQSCESDIRRSFSVPLPNSRLLSLLSVPSKASDYHTALYIPPKLDINCVLEPECYDFTPITPPIPPYKEDLSSESSPSTAFASLSISTIPTSTPSSPVQPNSDTCKPSLQHFHRPLSSSRSFSGESPIYNSYRFSSVSYPRENKRQRAGPQYEMPGDVMALGSGSMTIRPGFQGRPTLESTGQNAVRGNFIENKRDKLCSPPN